MSDIPEQELKKVGYIFWVVMVFLVIMIIIVLYFLLNGSNMTNQPDIKKNISQNNKNVIINKSKSYSLNSSHSLGTVKNNVSETDNSSYLKNLSIQTNITLILNESKKEFKKFNISHLNISRTGLLNVSLNQSINQSSIQNNSMQSNNSLKSDESEELKVYYNVYYDDNIMSGIYNQYYGGNNSLLNPLMTYDIENDENTPVTLTFVSEIQDYTSPSIDMIPIPSNSNRTIYQNPLLKSNVSIGEVTYANVHYKISIGNYTMQEETLPIKIYPKDTMIWGYYSDGEYIDQSYWIAAWVTPHINEIDELIRKSAEHHPDKAIDGYQCYYCSNEADWADYTALQVKAIYDSLKKDYKMTYINTPIAFGSNDESPQRVKLPKDSIKLSSANCIDGTILFASALDSIGIHPYIELIPGHAFICWDVAENSKTIDCLETTMIRDYDFEDAEREGIYEYNNEVSSGDFDKGKSEEIPVDYYRDNGIMPIT